MMFSLPTHICVTRPQWVNFNGGGSHFLCGYNYITHAINLLLVRLLNTLKLRHNGRHFADDSFKCIFLNENVCISSKISLKLVAKGPVNNIPALVQLMAWSEPMMVSLLTFIFGSNWYTFWYPCLRHQGSGLNELLSSYSLSTKRYTEIVFFIFGW